jgi:F-box/WD-40 domain protein 5
MKTFSWKYTQFSQFNCTDTLLLVSGVHFGTPHSTSGEIAVFRVARKCKQEIKLL